MFESGSCDDLGFVFSFSSASSHSSVECSTLRQSSQWTDLAWALAKARA